MTSITTTVLPNGFIHEGQDHKEDDSEIPLAVPHTDIQEQSTNQVEDLLELRKQERNDEISRQNKLEKERNLQKFKSLSRREQLEGISFIKTLKQHSKEEVEELEKIYKEGRTEKKNQEVQKKTKKVKGKKRTRKPRGRNDPPGRGGMTRNLLRPLRLSKIATLNPMVDVDVPQTATNVDG